MPKDAVRQRLAELMYERVCLLIDVARLTRELAAERIKADHTWCEKERVRLRVLLVGMLYADEGALLQALHEVEDLVERREQAP